MDEEKAKKHAVDAETQAKWVHVQHNIHGKPKGKNPFDPDMQMDHTGTNYYYLTVALDE